jgi:hypothetical protein
MLFKVTSTTTTPESCQRLLNHQKVSCRNQLSGTLPKNANQVATNHSNYTNDSAKGHKRS